ncbi:MAG: HEPN domain-containing protein [Nanoarchaeota archaeon]|nr:HEPN domain-containing protein [Nanoarchaeota archaeon]MBU4283914.1 HEPN domain-containing protein [Nanoarchaeota archaeon]MBU4493537.1 HEPN domain-containing protein [Nanoarchaeota archaeon]MCG2719763.1 HEPN domain-containing protein [Nanoarchaeota archaeon]
MDLKLLKKRLHSYKRKGAFRKNDREKDLALKYLEKARNNLIAMQLDFKISSNDKIQKVLEISHFTEYDWVLIKGYYAMYHAALACLAKLGFKSENHNATTLALELYFVHSGKLEEKYVNILEKARLEKDYVEKLREAKQERIIAQYNVSVDVEQRAAKWILETAKEFVDRLEKLFNEIKL